MSAIDHDQWTRLVQVQCKYVHLENDDPDDIVTCGAFINAEGTYHSHRKCQQSKRGHSDALDSLESDAGKAEKK